MRYVIEPALLALDLNSSEREFRQYVTRLLLWEQWMERNPGDVYVLSDTIGLLCGMQAFPIYPVFEQLLQRYKIDYVQASDLNQTINRLLTKARKIDNIGATKVYDDVILLRLDIDLKASQETGCDSRRDVMERILWYIYCQCRKSKVGISSFVLFARDIPDDITFNVEYQTLEGTGDDMREVMVRDSMRIICRSSLAGFFKNADTPVNILCQAETVRDLSLAIRVSIYQNGSLPRVMDSFNYDFHIQKSFMSDFNTAHYQTDTSIQRSLMEAMSHTLLNMNMSKREDWRKDKGGAARQQCHGGWQAWRRYVTQSVKMMYWQDGGKYRFANVKEHDIFVCDWED